ncbi:MAG: sulfatase-like hydrolase/transferase, partial [Thermoplasmata archaeon]
IILIVFDTLRKDVLPMYGGNANTPNLNEFIKDAVVFPNAISPTSWTLPSHVSLFTGDYLIEHEIHEGKNFFGNSPSVFEFKIKSKLIYEKLYQKGYNNILYSANGFINKSNDFNKSVNQFKNYNPSYNTYEDNKIVNEILNKYGITKKDIFINILKDKNFLLLKKVSKIYIKERINQKIKGFPFLKDSDLIVNDIFESYYREPFFMFINFMEVHEPLSKSDMRGNLYIRQSLDLLQIKNISKNIISKNKYGYLKSLKNLDYQFGRLMYYLKKELLFDNTLIIITSDHGQSFKENRKFPYYGHGIFLYNELIEVPLIVKFPKNKKIDIKKGYQSLTSVPKLIENVIDGNIEDVVSNEVVFSETYGNHNDLFIWQRKGLLPKYLDIDKINKKFFYLRKAVYKNDFKLVINGNNGDIEEFTLKSKNIDPQDHKEIFDDLLSELEIFKGTERFVVRK